MSVTSISVVRSDQKEKGGALDSFKIETPFIESHVHGTMKEDAL